MKALVEKTKKLVEIVEKKGEFYLDDDSNPYRKSELEFFINTHQQKEQNEFDCDDDNFGQIYFPFVDWMQRSDRNQSYMEQFICLATTVIETHPEWESKRVYEFCNDIMQSAINGMKK